MTAIPVLNAVGKWRKIQLTNFTKTPHPKDQFEELPEKCSQIVSKCSDIARTVCDDLLWTANFASAVTKWSSVFWQKVGNTYRLHSYKR